MNPLTSEHREWLTAQGQDLVRFASASAHPDGGFAWLDDTGRPEFDRPVETWICCRMTHVFALAAMQGDATARLLMNHGVEALKGRLRDRTFGGWFAAVDSSGPTISDKRAYEHAFVLIAAASATAAGHPDGSALLDDALAAFTDHFWREDDGLVVDVWDRTWQDLEDYRGVNANMHTVEALLAAADVTGDPIWAHRAARIVERVVHGFARGKDWRLPEHFDSVWNVRLDYNLAEPAHPFRPYGVTIGHLLEWSRLSLHVRTALGADAPKRLLSDARALFDLAVREGWDVDGAEGFVYTTDFEGTPVVRDRLHWVVAEGISAAWTLHVVTGEEPYFEWYQRWWAHADTLFIDHEHGSWRHELNARNRPASTVWKGKPDVYHAYQAGLLPRLGEITSFAGALLRRSRD